MESKIFMIVLIAHTLVINSSIVSGAAENVTEEATVEDVTSTTSEATSEKVPKGRSLSLAENEVEGKSGKRHPKFGFTIPLPNMPGVGGEFNATPSPSSINQLFGATNTEMQGIPDLGSTALLIKGGILSGLLALKASILPPIFLGALILFLIAGAAFFTCSIVNCGRFIGDIATGPGVAPGFGGLPSFNPFNRNGLNEYEQWPVFQAIDENDKKFQ